MSTPTSTSKSIFSRIVSYITSWFMFIFESIYSLYKDELEKQSRDESDYKKWKLYEEIQRKQQTQQYDEESVLGTSCASPSRNSTTPFIQEQKLSLEKQLLIPVKCETQNAIKGEPTEPICSFTNSEEKSVGVIAIEKEKEETPSIKKVNESTLPTIEKQKQDDKLVNNKPNAEPIKKVTNESVVQSTKPAIKNEQVVQQPKMTSDNTANQSSTTTGATYEKPSKPAEISGLIGERLKMKKFRNFSGNAYNSLIKPTANKEDTSNKKETITPPSNTTQEVIQQTNTQIIQRKLSSKPKRVSRRPSQQTIKHSDVLSKLETEATIDVPDVEKFKELEEFSQLEKKVGLENAIKQMKEKKSSTTSTPPPPPLSQVVNANNNSTESSPSKAKSNKVTLDAILSAKHSLRKTAEEWK